VPFRPQRPGQRQAQAPSERPARLRTGTNSQQVLANARHSYERYTALAKDAVRRGDMIEAENLYQHAEHFFRVMRDQCK
jgi:hypothetical protein